MASNVPKFASFRPKPKAAPETPKEHHTPEPGSERSRHHKREERIRSPPAKKPKLLKDASSSKSFYSDRRGDTDILRYGSLNKYDIPAYRRFGYGYVLGLPLSQKIDRELSTDKKLYITSARRPREERLLTAKHVAKADSRTLRFIKPNAETPAEADEDFIAVGTREKQQGSDEEDESLEATYRSIEGKPKLDQLSDPDTQYDQIAESIDVRSEVTRKNSELVRKTRESPEDIQAWLRFIDHQEAMLTIDRPSAELSEATKQQLADTRISIYEEALKRVHSNSHIQLYLGLFKEARRSWNHAKLASGLKEALAKYPGSSDLWFMYLDFLQGNLATFKYEACRVAFVQCLEALQVNAKSLPEVTLHIFVRMISMIHGAGYQELALAIWQAVLETHLSPPRSGGFHSFEDFWESEASRIGEDGAKGWKSASLDDVGPTNTQSLQSKDFSDALYDDFSKREVEATQKLRYPGRTADDVAEDDAFHTVFYGDIQEYMMFLPKTASTNLVLEAFLCFCGLPSLPRVANHHGSWWDDTFLSCVGASSVQSHLQSNDITNEFDLKLHRFAGSALQNHQMTSEHLFDHDFFLESMRLGADFVRRVLKQMMISDQASDMLGEYLLAYELHHFPSEVVKTAKQLLKTNPSSQRLYHAYGLVELRRGNATKAAQVFSMAIDLSKDGPYGSVESLMLLNSWAWEALHRSDTAAALWRIVSKSGKPAATSDPAALPDQNILESARSAISEASEKALLRHDYASAITCTSLLALLAYLPASDISAALTTHQNLTQFFTSHKLRTSPYAELHAQSIAQLLQYHITHAPIVKPSLARTALEPYIAAFPNNTTLLALYAANEARFAIDDRVRGIMQNSAMNVGTARSVAGWSFAIHFETLRSEIAGSTSHSIRALYKRATHPDASGAHSPALWSSYLRFEVVQLRLQRTKSVSEKSSKDGHKRGWESRLEEAEGRVRDVFFAGLRCLPWCKDFAMLAFGMGDVRGVLGEEGLARVYGVMEEKEMRVYVEVEGM